MGIKKQQNQICRKEQKMKKTGWIKTMVILLVVVAVSSPVFAGRGGRGRVGGRGPGPGWNMPGGPLTKPQGSLIGPACTFMPGIGGGPGICAVPLRILRQLDLSDEQVKAIQEVVEANKEKAEASRKAIAEATKALHEATVKGDEAGIQEAGKNLGKAIGKGAVLRASTMNSVKEVLTDEQREKVEELTAKLKEWAEKMKDPNLGPMFQPFGQRGSIWGRGMGLGRGLGLGAGRGPGIGVGRGPGIGAGRGRGRGAGRGAGMGAGRGPGRGAGRGPGRGAGRGPGMGAGRGAGRGPGRGWGAGQSPETWDRGWRRGPLDEDFGRPRRRW
jgi:Spy/CpxP family protein refolding chaperone